MLVEHHERLVDLEQELHLNYVVVVDLEPDLDVLVEHHERLVDLEQELHLNYVVERLVDLEQELHLNYVVERLVDLEQELLYLDGATRERCRDYRAWPARLAREADDGGPVPSIAAHA